MVKKGKGKTGAAWKGKEQLMPVGNITLGHYYTKLLTSSYHHTNRNVTTDNYLTSVLLVADQHDNCGMTLELTKMK